jgi:hypothetical protein
VAGLPATDRVVARRLALGAHRHLTEPFAIGHD